MRIVEKLKVFCKEEHYPIIDEIAKVVDMSGNIKVTTTRNNERLKIVLNKFKFSRDYLYKDITILTGDVGIRDVYIMSDFAIILLEGKKQIFNKLEDYKELIVYESEV